MSPLLFNFPSPTPLGTHLLTLLKADEGRFVRKSFPDGETYLRIETPVENREVIVNVSLCLHKPPSPFVILGQEKLCFSKKNISFSWSEDLYIKEDLRAKKSLNLPCKLSSSNPKMTKRENREDASRDPIELFLSLFFLSDALRMQKAKKITLLSPYLPYMRQDKIFQTGEALTSRTFSQLISNFFDELITIDPHLHRYHSLSEIYSIPATVLHAAPLLSGWIQEHVSNPFLIGPDAESAQWVKEVAGDFPFIVLTKVRHPDGHVEITWPHNVDIGEKTPILVDDIISSGGTMAQAIEHLRKIGAKPPICLAIHPIFAGNAYQNLMDVGARKIVTCNTIPHPTNQIDVTSLVSRCIL